MLHTSTSLVHPPAALNGFMGATQSVLPDQSPDPLSLDDPTESIDWSERSEEHTSELQSQR